MPSLWIFNHYAGLPETVPATRTYELANELQSLGWDVTVIACSFNHYSFKDDIANNRPGAVTKNIRGVRWVFMRSFPYQGNGTARLRNMVTYATKAVTWSRGQTAPDIIIGTSVHPFAAEAARRISLKLGVPFVYEVTDLWPESLVDLGSIRRNSPIFRLMFRMERAAVRTASGVIGLMPGLPDYVQQTHHRQLAEFCYIPNGMNPTKKTDRDAAPVRGSIAYAGGFARAHGLDIIIRAAEMLEQQRPGSFRFHLYGDGAGRLRLESKVKALGLSRTVLFHGFIPKVELRPHLAKAEILVCTGEALPVHRFGVSFNKLFDYFDAARPVVFSVSSGNDPVRQSGAGVSCRAGNARELAHGLSAIHELSSTERTEMGERGRDFLIREHDFRVLALRLNNFLWRLLDIQARTTVTAKK